MKENMYQPMLAARHSLPWFAFLSLHLYEADLLQTARIIHSTICKHNRTIEEQANLAPDWRYQIIKVYKHLAHLRAIFLSLLLNSSKLQYYGV
jgi:hypothetical protein